MKKKLEKIFKYISATQIFFIALFLYVLNNFSNRFINVDSDILWHTRQGQWMLENHKIVIDKEIFSYIMDKNDFTNLSWLSDIFWALSYNFAGFKAITILSIVLVVTSITIVFNYNLKKTNSILFSFIVSIGIIPIVLGHWFSRPHLYTHVILPIVIILMEKIYRERNYKLFFILFLINILWAALHHGMIFGSIVIFCFGMGAIIDYMEEKSKENFNRIMWFFIGGIGNFAATLINPFGIKAYTEFFSKEKFFVSQMISEFSSTNLHNGIYINIVYALVLLIIIVVPNKKMLKPYFFMIVIFQYFSMEYVRNVSIYGLVLGISLINILDFEIFERNLKKFKEKLKYIIFNKSLNECNEKLSNERNKVPIVLLVFLIIVLGTFTSKCFEKNFRFNPKLGRQYPQKAMEYLKNHKMNGNGWNSYLYGGYMIWGLYPEKKVIMDPRAGNYPTELLKDYFGLDPRTWEILEFAKKYNIEWFFTNRNDEIAKFLIISGKVEVLYEDSTAVILKLKKTEVKNGAK